MSKHRDKRRSEARAESRADLPKPRPAKGYPMAEGLQALAEQLEASRKKQAEQDAAWASHTA